MTNWVDPKVDLPFNDFIIDCEALSTHSQSIVVDLSAIAFNSDLSVIETFDELVNNGIKIKFQITSQKERGRVSTSSTIAWWKTQPPEVRQALIPTKEDVTIEEGLDMFRAYLAKHRVNPKEAHGYCRGQSYDFPILSSLLRDEQRAKGIADYDIDTVKLEPCLFFNQRDIRTAIESMLLTRGITQTPMPDGVLDGFIAHNSIHDCAKDILMLKYAYAYATGSIEPPTNKETT
ncbi:exonuclease [Shewanella phage Thanatos-2]|nr:exonuclease [Shewanella phage Thanatos-2]